MARFWDRMIRGSMPNENQGFMKPCECGGYRLGRFVDGEWVWAAGCRACDTIERLRTLLEGKVRVTSGSMDPGKLKIRCDLAEEKVERLKEELERAKIELKRAQSSARAAKRAMERMREGCHYAHMAERITGPEWN